MTSLRPVHRLVLAGQAALLAAFVICQAPIVQAAGPVATVAAIEPARVADVIMLRGGFDAGLRSGMICRITRGNAGIAEVLLVDLRPAHSAALIMSVSPGQTIRAGDVVSIKVLKI